MEFSKSAKQRRSFGREKISSASAFLRALLFFYRAFFFRNLQGDGGGLVSAPYLAAEHYQLGGRNLAGACMVKVECKAYSADDSAFYFADGGERGLLCLSEITLNMFIFWVLSLVMYVFFIGLADKIFECARAWFFKKAEERASYDNLIDMVSCVTGFSGYIVSLFYVPSLRMAVLFNFLATFSWCAGILAYNISHRIKI